MSSTRTLASYASKLRYEDLPQSVVEKGKHAILDALGNSIGGYPLSLSETFLDLAKELGGGRAQATLIGDGTKVCVPLAAFYNGALSTMLDYCDSQSSESGRSYAWTGALAVPAALAAGESKGISGKDLITSVVAGYEVAARIVHSMDRTPEQAQRVRGSTVSVFAAAGAAARALGLGEDEYLSTLGMAGVYAPAMPASYKFLGAEGLTPRRDIKQGWSWMCMTGTFAAVSAQKGLKMLQDNHILDGERGLSPMLGMDIFNEEQLTADLGQTYHIEQFGTKLYPGCAVTHTAIAGAEGLVRDHGIDLRNVEGIDVVTNRFEGIGFDERDPVSTPDMEFSIPYQVSAALLAGDRGPDWYSDSTAKSAEVTDMMKRVSLSFDEECDQVFQDRHLRMCKVTIVTKDGQRYNRRVDQAGRARSAEEITNKFITTTSQVIDREQIDKILGTIETLEAAGTLPDLIDLLRVPTPQAR